MISFYRKYGRTIFDILLIVITVYLFMYLFSGFYKIAKPVVFGLVIYLMIEPLARFLNKKGMKKIIATTISTLVLLAVIILVFILLGTILTNQIVSLSANLPEYINLFQTKLLDWFDLIGNQISGISPDIVNNSLEYLSGIASKFAVYLNNFLGVIVNSITTVSGFLVNFALGLVLAFFLSLEIKIWHKFGEEKVPKTFKNAFLFLKENVIKGIVVYLKSQLKLISITFVLVFIGLLIIGNQNVFALAIFAAILDLLPLLGISALFLPWIGYQLIIGDYTMAISLGVIFVTVAVIRQILEPKITGESLGVSAFTMLAFMLISLSIFGVIGLIISPVLLITIKALIDQGYLKRWIHLPKEEFDN